MSLKAAINIPGLSRIRSQIGALSRPVDLREDGMGLLVGAKMKELTIGNFEKQADPRTGKAWAKGKGVGFKRPGSRILENNPGSGLKGSINAAQPIVDAKAVSIGTNKVYARIHQEGGVIRAKPGKALAIPVTQEAARAGSARRFMQKNPKAFIWRKKEHGEREAVNSGKPGYIVTPFRKTKIKIHFLLRKSVTIPARPFMGWSTEARAEVARLVRAWWARRMEVADGGK
jgi:phage gpG-like protein